MRSLQELLGIQNRLVGEAEGVDYLHAGHYGLTEEEIAYIRHLGDRVETPNATCTCLNAPGDMIDCPLHGDKWKPNSKS